MPPVLYCNDNLQVLIKVKIKTHEQQDFIVCHTKHDAWQRLLLQSAKKFLMNIMSQVPRKIISPETVQERTSCSHADVNGVFETPIVRVSFCRRNGYVRRKYPLILAIPGRWRVVALRT